MVAKSTGFGFFKQMVPSTKINVKNKKKLFEIPSQIQKWKDFMELWMVRVRTGPKTISPEKRCTMHVCPCWRRGQGGNGLHNNANFLKPNRSWWIKVIKNILIFFAFPYFISSLRLFEKLLLCLSVQGIQLTVDFVRERHVGTWKIEIMILLCCVVT